MLCSEAYVENEKEKTKLALTQAYATAAWSRTKKMPKLDTVLNDVSRKPRKKKQTTNEILESIKVINATLGGVENGKGIR